MSTAFNTKMQHLIDDVLHHHRFNAMTNRCSCATGCMNRRAWRRHLVEEAVEQAAQTYYHSGYMAGHEDGATA